MKKICFLIGNINHSGGTERVTTLIANELSSTNQIYILSLNNGKNPFFEQDSSIINENIFDEKISMKKYYLKTVSKIRKYLISNKIDILIVVDSISCVFTVPACIGLRINHICWEHFNLKVNLGSRFRDLGRWMAAKGCSRIVTLTERDKLFWEEKFNLKNTHKVITIANPSPYQDINHIPKLQNKVVLAVGRLDYIKGFDLLLKAWAIVCKETNDWILNIVGGGEEEVKLKQLAAELDITSRVIFWGQQKNVDQFYRKASIYCLSSRNEGFPMVLLEAQSYGLPIVSFDCDTGPSELIMHGINGYLAIPNSIPSLTEQILSMTKLVNEKYESFCDASKNNSKNFSKEKITELWLNSVIN